MQGRVEAAKTNSRGVQCGLVLFLPESYVCSSLENTPAWGDGCFPDRPDTSRPRTREGRRPSLSPAGPALGPEPEFSL